MANEFDSAPEEGLHEMERYLFDSVEKCQGWSTLAHARELLRREIVEVSRWRLSRGEDSWIAIDDLDPSKARQIAVFQLASLCSRAAGSVVALVSCGYVPEAKAPLRRLREAGLRARLVLDDESGHHARAWLSGRPLRGMAYLESRYGSTGAMKLLSPAAHADVKGLLPLLSDKESRVQANLAPQRNEKWVEPMFRFAALEILGFLGMMAETHPQYMSFRFSREIEELQEELEVPLFKFGAALYLEGDSSEYVRFESEST